jgi:hypothetical protein
LHTTSWAYDSQKNTGRGGTDHQQVYMLKRKDWDTRSVRAGHWKWRWIFGGKYCKLIIRGLLLIGYQITCR